MGGCGIVLFSFLFSTTRANERASDMSSPSGRIINYYPICGLVVAIPFAFILRKQEQRGKNRTDGEKKTTEQRQPLVRRSQRRERPTQKWPLNLSVAAEATGAGAAVAAAAAASDS